MQEDDSTIIEDRLKKMHAAAMWTSFTKALMLGILFDNKRKSIQHCFDLNGFRGNASSLPKNCR